MLKLLKLFRYLRAKEWLFCLFSLVFVCAQVVLELMIPDYMSEITTLIETPGSAMGDVWSAGGMMLLCAFGSLVSSIAVCFFASRIAANFSKRLRKEMFYKVESFTLEEINAFSTASLITRSTNDVVQVQMLVVLSLQVVVKAPLMAVWAIMKIAGKAWQWSLATGIAVVLLVVILSFAIVRTFPRFKRIQWLQDSLNQSARENLTYRAALYGIPLPWIAVEAGWFVAEYGRQPWAIGEVLPTAVANSSLTAGDLIFSMVLICGLYTLFLVAELFLMFKFARLGPSSLKTGRYHFEQSSTTTQPAR